MKIAELQMEKYKILIVDDEPDNLALLYRTLRGKYEIAKDYRHCVDVLKRISARELEQLRNEFDEMGQILESWDEKRWLESGDYEDIIAYWGRFGEKRVILRFDEHESDSQVYMYIQYEGGYGLPWYQCSIKRIVDPDEGSQITTGSPNRHDFFQIYDNIFAFNYEIQNKEEQQ